MGLGRRSEGIRLTRRQACGLGMGALLLLAHRAEAAPWRQREFVISFWSPPPPTETTDARYAEIAEAGFNVVMGGNGVANKQASLAMLDRAKAHGLKAIVLDDRVYGGKPDGVSPVLADYGKHPALYGFLIQDEPGKAAFPALASTVAEFGKRAPQLLPYINLFPNYATPAQTGFASYDEYVSTFADQVRPPLLSFDHYAFLRSGERPDLFANMETIRREAARIRVPFWAILQAEGIEGTYRSPSDVELEWQVWLALAHGASGILYFTYWTPPPSGGENHFDGIVSPDGKLRAHYQWVKRVNAELGAVGRKLFGLPQRGVYYSEPVPTGCSPVVKNTVIQSLQGDSVVVGLFELASNRTYIVLVNRSLKSSVEVKLNLHDDFTSLIDATTDDEKPQNLLRRDLNFPARITTALPAGGGKLFLAERPRYKFRG